MVGVYHVGHNLDGAPLVCVLNLLLKPLMLGDFTTLPGRLFQESTLGEDLLVYQDSASLLEQHQAVAAPSC